jgi:hypothetical protein
LTRRSRQAPIGHEIEAFLSPWEEDALHSQLGREHQLLTGSVQRPCEIECCGMFRTMAFDPLCKVV